MRECPVVVHFCECMLCYDNIQALTRQSCAGRQVRVPDITGLADCQPDDTLLRNGQVYRRSKEVGNIYELGTVFLFFCHTCMCDTTGCP